MSAPKKTEVTPAVLPSLDTPEGRDEILRRAALDDDDVRSLTHQLLVKDRADGGNLIDVYGDSFVHAVLEMVRAVSGGDLTFQEGMLLKIREVRDGLAGPNPTPLERILCERVALTWFSVNDADRQLSRQQDMTLKQSLHRETRRDMANKRFLNACKTLATVRRLGNPSIQINQLGGRQEINVSNA